MSEITLKKIENFIIKTGEAKEHYGGDQKWFVGKDFIKEAACGATTCANILGYMSRDDDNFKDVCSIDTSEKEKFIEFMKSVYPYVKPGLIGIMPADFIKGAVDYSKTCGVDVTSDLLTVPASQKKRPSAEYMKKWVSAAIADDIPVAFLNLSSGRVKNLDGYHWVTIVAIDVESGMVKIVDNGRLLDVNLVKWLKKSTVGGAFVVIESN